MSAELMAAVAALLGVVIGAGVVGLMARSRLKAAAERLQHLEHQRHQAQQQNTSARRQVEVLAKEVGELRGLMSRRGVTPPPREHLSPEAAAAEAAAEEAPADKAFQATQLIQRGTE